MEKNSSQVFLAQANLTKQEHPTSFALNSSRSNGSIGSTKAFHRHPSIDKHSTFNPNDMQSLLAFGNQINAQLDQRTGLTTTISSGIHTNNAGSKLTQKTLHSKMLNGVKLDSQLTRLMNKKLDHIQNRRAKEVANDLIYKQAQMIKNIKRLPPGALQTEAKYKKAKEDHHKSYWNEINKYVRCNFSGRKSQLSQASLAYGSPKKINADMGEVEEQAVPHLSNIQSVQKIEQEPDARGVDTHSINSNYQKKKNPGTISNRHFKTRFPLIGQQHIVDEKPPTFHRRHKSYSKAALPPPQIFNTPAGMSRVSAIPLQLQNSEFTTGLDEASDRRMLRSTFKSYGMFDWMEPSAAERNIENFLASPKEQNQARQMLLGKNFMPYLNKSDHRSVSHQYNTLTLTRRGRKQAKKQRSNQDKVREMTRNLSKASHLKVNYKQNKDQFIKIESPLMTSYKRENLSFLENIILNNPQLLTIQGTDVMSDSLRKMLEQGDPSLPEVASGGKKGPGSSMKKPSFEYPSSANLFIGGSPNQHSSTQLHGSSPIMVSDRKPQNKTNLQMGPTGNLSGNQGASPGKKTHIPRKPLPAQPVEKSRNQKTVEKPTFKSKSPPPARESKKPSAAPSRASKAPASKLDIQKGKQTHMSVKPEPTVSKDNLSFNNFKSKQQPTAAKKAEGSNVSQNTKTSLEQKRKNYDLHAQSGDDIGGDGMYMMNSSMDITDNNSKKGSFRGANSNQQPGRGSSRKEDFNHQTFHQPGQLEVGEAKRGKSQSSSKQLRASKKSRASRASSRNSDIQAVLNNSKYRSPKKEPLSQPGSAQQSRGQSQASKISRISKESGHFAEARPEGPSVDPSQAGNEGGEAEKYDSSYEDEFS